MIKKQGGNPHSFIPESVGGNLKNKKGNIMKHYFYSDGEKQKGPFTFEQLKKENIDKDTLVWFEGLSDWKPVKEIKELEDILQLTPPPVPGTETESNTINNESDIISEESTPDNDNTESYTPKKRGMFSNPFSFNGRIRRLEYGISFIIYVFIAVFVNAILESGGDETAILGLAYIPMLWFLWAQGAKRCHDLGNNGWWQIIPFYGLWMLFQNGQPGLNKYGVNPKN